MSDAITAIYVRVAHKDNFAIACQKNILLDYAVKHGYMNCKCYEDNGYSGLTLDRPAIKALEDEIRAGRIQRVIAFNISRIARDTGGYLKWIRFLSRYNVELISMDYPMTAEMNEILSYVEKVKTALLSADSLKAM